MTVTRTVTKVAVLFNERPGTVSHRHPHDRFEEYDSRDTINRIADCLRDLRLDIHLVPADRSLLRRLRHGHYDIAFNIAEGPLDLVGRARRCREAIPALAGEMVAVPFTGSDPFTLAVTLDKALARRIVSSELRVANGVLLETESDEVQLDALTFPVVVKPNDEGSSKGILHDAIADDLAGAVRRSRQLRARYRCPVLVEEFLPGTEVTVAVAGNRPRVRILGMMEIAPATDTARFLYSLDVKRDYRRQVTYHVPPRVSSHTIEQLSADALSAYRLLGCRDIARMDFRLDASGRPHFIECNALPGLNPESSDLVIMTRDTLPYAQLVQGILHDAARRCGVSLHGNQFT